jgi:hypothetical protein
MPTVPILVEQYLPAYDRTTMNGGAIDALRTPRSRDPIKRVYNSSNTQYHK